MSRLAKILIIGLVALNVFLVALLLIKDSVSVATEDMEQEAVRIAVSPARSGEVVEMAAQIMEEPLCDGRKSYFPTPWGEGIACERTFASTPGAELCVEVTGVDVGDPSKAAEVLMKAYSSASGKSVDWLGTGRAVSLSSNGMRRLMSLAVRLVDKKTELRGTMGLLEFEYVRQGQTAVGSSPYAATPPLPFTE